MVEAYGNQQTNKQKLLESERLTKHVRLVVYSFLETNELILAISKLSTRERANLVNAQLCNKERSGTIVLPKDCFLHQITFQGLTKQIGHILSMLTYLTIKIDFSQVCIMRKHRVHEMLARLCLVLPDKFDDEKVTVLIDEGRE